MKTIIFITLLLLGFSHSGTSQLKLYSFEEAEKLAAENPKPFMIFVNASWCRYCRIMENTTFKNQEVIEKLNSGFYFISLDAEHKKDIYFNSQTFRFIPTGLNTGNHELAVELSINRQPVYPLIVILDPNYNILVQKENYTDASSLLMILTHFGTSENKNEVFSQEAIAD